MNDDKTEFIVIGSRQQLQKIKSGNININSIQIPRSHVIRYLGVDLDETLSLKSMIIRKCRVAMGNIQKLKQIRNTLTVEACKTIACGLILSHLDYANSLYYGLPKKEIRKLQIVQNMAAKVITRKDRYESATESLKELHWLPIHLRIKYKIITTVFKTLHSQAPKYLSDKISLNKTTIFGLRSQKNSKYLAIPRVKHMTFAARSFSVAGPQLWNFLSESLRRIEKLAEFKRDLKTFLFDQF